MAIYLPKTDSLILQTPKTGSRWLEAAIDAAGVEYELVGPTGLRGHGDLKVHGRSYRSVCCFVRSPLSWYPSYWAYRQAKKWAPYHPIDGVCASADFDEFIELTLVHFPGRLTRLFEDFAGPVGAEIPFVGKQERLVTDLVRFLGRIGETYSVEAIQETAPVNVTPSKPPWNSTLRAHIIQSEIEVFRRFDYPYKKEPV